MTPVGQVVRTRQELDATAWQFLGSRFTGFAYANWPIERRVDAYLLHDGQADIVNDGSVFDALMGHVMANLGAALHSGMLQSRNDGKSP